MFPAASRKPPDSRPAAVLHGLPQSRNGRFPDCLHRHCIRLAVNAARYHIFDRQQLDSWAGHFEKRLHQKTNDMKALKILFADDDLKYSMLLKRFLEKEGYEVTYAGNGKIALERCV